MNIEVTNNTFHKIFDKGSYFIDTERKELANKHSYYNEELEQRGVVIYNHLTGTEQYYLTDINA